MGASNILLGAVSAAARLLRALAPQQRGPAARRHGRSHCGQVAPAQPSHCTGGTSPRTGQVAPPHALRLLGVQGLGTDACHCMHCNACMALSEFPRHKCRDLSACPVCTEYLFDSSQPYRVRRPGGAASPSVSTLLLLTWARGGM